MIPIAMVGVYLMSELFWFSDVQWACIEQFAESILRIRSHHMARRAIPRKVLLYNQKGYF